MHDAVPGQAVAAVRGYRIERCIGAGGMAAVYEARRLGASGPRERVACKVMHEEPAGLAVPPAEHARRLARHRELARQEAVLGLRITAGHPNLVQILDYFDDARGPETRRCIVMELVDGADVAELRGPDRRLPFPVTRRIACEVLEALVYLHGLGVLHRDLSPRNILVSAGGAVKVADLGLAKVMEQGRAHTRTFRGVTIYASPEALQSASLDARTDLFTLGAVLFDLVAGTPPCGELEWEATIILHMVQGQYLPLPPDTPSDLAALITGLLHVKREERRPHSAALALALLRGHDQPMASTDDLVALVASATARRESEGRPGTDARSAGVLAPGHVLAPGQHVEAPGPSAPGQASDDMVRLRLHAPQRAPVLRAAGVAMAVACVLALGLLAHDQLRRGQDASLRLPSTEAPGASAEPTHARRDGPVAPGPVMPERTPEQAECPRNAGEPPSSPRAGEPASGLQRGREAGRRGVRHRERARVRGTPVPLDDEPPSWGRP